MKFKNKIELYGEILTEPEVVKEKEPYSVYGFKIAVRRLSGKCDYLPVLALECSLCGHKGDVVKLVGKIKSAIVGDRLKHRIYCMSMELAEDRPGRNNQLTFGGVVVLEPWYEKTSDGKECTIVTLKNENGCMPIAFFGWDSHSTRYIEKGTKIEAFGRLEDVVLRRTQVHKYTRYRMATLKWKVLREVD